MNEGMKFAWGSCVLTLLLALVAFNFIDTAQQEQVQTGMIRYHAEQGQFQYYYAGTWHRADSALRRAVAGDDRIVITSNVPAARTATTVIGESMFIGILRLHDNQIQTYTATGWTCANQEVRNILEADDEVINFTYDTASAEDSTITINADWDATTFQFASDDWEVNLDFTDEGLVTSGDLNKLDAAAELLFTHFLKNLADEYLEANSEQ